MFSISNSRDGFEKTYFKLKKKTFELISKANGTNTYLQPEVFGCKEKGSPS